MSVSRGVSLHPASGGARMTTRIRDAAEISMDVSTWSNLLRCVVIFGLWKGASTIKNHTSKFDQQNSGNFILAVEISDGATPQKSDSAMKIAVRNCVALLTTGSPIFGVTVSGRKKQRASEVNSVLWIQAWSNLLQYLHLAIKLPWKYVRLTWLGCS